MGSGLGGMMHPIQPSEPIATLARPTLNTEPGPTLLAPAHCKGLSILASAA
jgi:hypothetical protein